MVRIIFYILHTECGLVRVLLITTTSAARGKAREISRKREKGGERRGEAKVQERVYTWYTIILILVAQTIGRMARSSQHNSMTTASS